MAPGVGMLAEHDHSRNGARATEHGNGEWDEGDVVFGRPLHELLRDLLFPRRLLLDSRGVDLTIVYSSSFASRHLLEVIIFQGPYQGFARFRRTCEHKTLESNKSHPD